MSFRKEYDSKRHRQSAWQKWLPLIGLIVIIGFFGSVMWSAGSYSNAAIINQYFYPNHPNISSQDFGKNDLSESNHNFLIQQMAMAESYYKNKNYSNAVEAYDLILTNQNDSIYNIENINFDLVKWNHSLMLLGNGDRSKAIEKLGIFATSNMSEQLKADAVQLKKTLNSFWYGWAN